MQGWHVAGIVICFQAFNMPQFSGDRLTAVAALLGLFGLASLPLTYFLHFFFVVSWIALLLLPPFCPFARSFVLCCLGLASN